MQLFTSKQTNYENKDIPFNRLAIPLTAFQYPDSKGRIDFELEEMNRDTLLVASFTIADLNRENVKIDTILPGQAQYTHLAETDTIAYNVVIGSANGTQSIALALLPGERIKVTGNMQDWLVEGSKLNATYAQIQKACYPYRTKMDSLDQIITEKIYKEEYLPTWRQKDSMQAYYIRQHPDDDLSLLILAEIRREWVDELYPTLTERVKNGPFAPIAQIFDENFRIRRIFEENKKRIVEGAEAPDFTLYDLQGQPLSLRSLRGKYVVLDFWGSWCGWCIKGIPDMKEYYEKYRDKMEILGIDCHDKEEAWKSAVKEHGLPWLNVRDENQPDVSLLYAIEGYPTKIIITPEGKIAKIVRGESPVFYEYLDELFNKPESDK